MKIAVTLASLLLFVVLATANGAGYRYGVSDEAAYVPAVMLAENPAAFPHDASLIRTQGQFFIFDDIMGGIGRATGTSLESLFLAAYLISIAAVWIGVVLLGRQLYQSVWLAIAFGALITLRHHIPRTSVNSLEPYFQARVLAFGIGIAAVAMFLRQRQMAAVALVALAGFCHATTGLWFAILIGTALMILDRRWRMPGAVVIAVAVISLVWRMATGPSMDPIWIEALGGRDFIFANEWPLSAWLTNVGFLAALWATHAVRVRRGTATSFDAALMWGATALVALFMLTLPSVAAHVALAVQFQFSRQAMMFALVLLAVSAARGAYVMTQEHAERSLFQVSLPESPWVEAMHWLASRPLNAHVLADPGHAFKYGLSVRVASGRDVLLEDDKDAAVAMYSRAIAGRVVDRRRALADFPSLTAARARALAAQYDLDYLVTEATLPLPEVYRNAQFRIYALKPGGPAS
ncbi:MAG: hypothetical protein DMF88_25055 [Acidobacteria bacterium]|nr:MAG: hypothetical protein DMF88_25055 [Acidobacteriota bacterium]